MTWSLCDILGGLFMGGLMLPLPPISCYNVFMVASTQLLDRLLDPVGRALSPEAARRLIALRADAEAQARMDSLAERANEGLLTEEEREEYHSLVSATSLIAVLQAKARAALAEPAA
jgi:hypothetical protein